MLTGLKGQRAARDIYKCLYHLQVKVQHLRVQFLTPSTPQKSVIDSSCIIKKARRSLSSDFMKAKSTPVTPSTSATPATDRTPQTPSTQQTPPKQVVQDEVSDNLLLEALAKIDEMK